MKFNRVLAVVGVHVHTNFHQAKCSGPQVIMPTKFLCSRYGEKSGPVTLTFDLAINYGS